MLAGGRVRNGCGLHNLWRSHFGVDEHPFATYFDVHQGYRVLSHSPMGNVRDQQATVWIVFRHDHDEI